MTSKLYDKKAVQILFDTHWTVKGWRRHYSTAPSDLAYAISKGVMFPRALLPHDATLQRLRDVCDSILPSRVGDAFLVSLGSRELALRSALGSFAVARSLPVHPFTPDLPYYACRICGLELAPAYSQAEDPNVLNFERLKWGGVRHDDVQYQLLDLEQFHKLDPCEPSDEDVDILRRILATIRTLPPKATASHFEKALSTALPSNKDERCQMIKVLSLCGVLSYSGYRNYFDRSEPPKGRAYRDSEWGIPAMYWRAQDGYDAERLSEYFPRYASMLAMA